MNNEQGLSYTIKNFKRLLVATYLFGVLLLPLSGLAQTPAKVAATLDTAAITLGEQLHYTITVATDSTAFVHFPEGQTFSPLETVAALPIDTTTANNRRILQRRYALTQFDSGAYTIPPQRIAINEQAFFTDSFHIKVAGVAIDTTQPLYDIKPLLAVEKSTTPFWTILPWMLLALLVVGGLVYWFLLRKKPLSESEAAALLPPYDRALLALKNLENSKYLIQNKYKAYYSELTTIVRSYLEQDVHIAALESTTAQLIAKLQLLKDAGKLRVDAQTLAQFQTLLQTADLVKFAKSKPPTAAAERDRQLVEQMVTQTHRALPQPTEKELLQNEAYVKALAQKKRRRNLYWAATVLAGLFLLGGVFSVGYFGVKHVKTTVFGSSTKTLWEGEWMSSAYGFPPVALETPQVLLRQAIPLPPQLAPLVKEAQAFAYGSYTDAFAVTTRSVTYKEPTVPKVAATVEATLTAFERLGLKNVTTKEEEFVTKAGVQGVKTYGTGTFTQPEGETSKTIAYTILSFAGKGFIQQVVLSWEKGDTYAEHIVNRIVNSIDVKKQV